MTGSADLAREIATQSLNATGLALAHGDHAGFARYVGLPYSLGTEDGATMMDTPEAVRNVFDRAVDSYATFGITRLDRTVSAARFIDPDTIAASHMTQPVCGTEPLDVPYPNHVILRRQASDWKVAHGQHVVGHMQGHSRVILGAAMRDAPDDMIDILRDVVHRFGNAQLEGDFNALRRCVNLPFFLHGRNTTEMVETEVQLRAGFDQRMTRFKVRGISDVVRLVKSVALLGPGRMHGVVRTHILNGSTLVVPSYTTAVTLLCGPDAIWRLCSACNPHRLNELPHRHT
ncbi:hypothetical protein [Sagittula sp. S175]|uniref:hypothetical protein n=1 Tax=Sagittula sp. S175 TaxID=3415129 RepID=UPI003C7C0BA9